MFRDHRFRAKPGIVYEPHDSLPLRIIGFPADDSQVRVGVQGTGVGVSDADRQPCRPDVARCSIGSVFMPGLELHSRCRLQEFVDAIRPYPIHGQAYSGLSSLFSAVREVANCQLDDKYVESPIRQYTMSACPRKQGARTEHLPQRLTLPAMMSLQRWQSRRRPGFPLCHLSDSILSPIVQFRHLWYTSLSLE